MLRPSFASGGTIRSFISSIGILTALAIKKLLESLFPQRCRFHHQLRLFSLESRLKGLLASRQ